MARLPAPEDYGTSIPQPSRGFTAHAAAQRTPPATRTPLVTRAITREPDLYTGAALKQAGVDLADFGKQLQIETDKLDAAKAQDALNKIQQARLDLTMGDKGAYSAKGGDVMTPTYASGFKSRFDVTVEGIMSDLTPAQRAKLEPHAKREGLGFQTDIARHSMTQAEVYQTNTATASIALGAELAKAGKLQDGLLKAAPIVESEILRRGFSGDAAISYRKDMMGLVHAAAIDGLLARGDPAAAALYLKTNTEAMSKKQTDHYDGIVKAQNAYVGGRNLAMETVGMSPTDAQKYISEKAGADKDMANAAYAELTHRKAAEQDAALEAKGALVSDFAKAGFSYRALSAARASPAYLAMTPKDRGDFDNYAQHTAQSAQDRAENKADRAERRDAVKWDQNVEALAIFDQLASNPDIVRLSVGQIHSYAPYIGPKLVATLDAHRKNLIQHGAAFKIDPALINASLPEKLQKATGDAEQQQKSAFKGIIARSLVEWKQQNPGKTPNDSEQQAIVRSASREFVEVGSLWNSSTKAYQLGEGVKAVPKDFYDGIRAAAAKKGKKISDDEIVTRYQALGRRR